MERMVVPSSDGVSISYEDRGSGPAVIFIHAFPLNAGLWSPQLRELAGFRRIAPDLRGFGGSGAPRGEPSLGVLAEDVLCVMDAAREESAHFVGCSLGGYVLMEILRRRPGCVRSVALVDTRASAETPEGAQGRLSLAARLLQGGPEARREFEAGMLERLLARSRREPEVLEAVRRMMAEASVEGIAYALLAIAHRPPSFETLRSFEGPALIVRGAEDVIVPEAEAEAMYSACRRAWFLSIPGVGHLPSLESPGILDEALFELWKQPC